MFYLLSETKKYYQIQIILNRKKKDNEEVINLIDENRNSMTINRKRPRRKWDESTESTENEMEQRRLKRRRIQTTSQSLSSSESFLVQFKRSRNRSNHNRNSQSLYLFLCFSENK